MSIFYQYAKIYEDPKGFLDQVHKKMIAKYAFDQQVEQMEKQAEKIETFFNEIKTASVSQKATSTIYENLVKKINNRTLFEKGGAIGGTIFEEEVVQVMQAVTELTVQRANENFKQSFSRMSTGKVQANVKDIGKLTDFIAESYTQEVLAASKEVSKEQGDKHITFSTRSGKVDIQGANLTDIKFEMKIDKEVQEIVNILNTSTFSAKNYSGTKIKLGNTDFNKVYFSVLQDLGYDKNMILASLDILSANTQTSEVYQRLNEIRYVYELTGAGLAYTTDGFFKDNAYVQFLIINKPGGNISVRSTAGLISDYLNGGLASKVSPFGRKRQKIKMSTSLMKRVKST